MLSRSSTFFFRRMSSNANFRLPKQVNEANLNYKTGSVERLALEAELVSMTAAAPFFVPAFIGGVEVSFLPLFRTRKKSGGETNGVP